MKVGIFTSRSLNPLHPRLETLTNYFSKRNISFEIIEPESHSIWSRINWISLFFFDVYANARNRRKIYRFDVVLVQDIKNLPLARYSKKKGKRVVYETIDNNVHLRTYLLIKRFPILKPLKNIIIRHFEKREKHLAYNFCDEIIVNSRSLQSYFDDRATLAFYCSSFEEIKSENKVQNPPALIYLGDFSTEKGAEEILELQKAWSLPLFIFGTVSNPALRSETEGTGSIHHKARMPHSELSSEFASLMDDYFLIGTSLIRPVNISYATQEANKDIDYLAMGIPIIGNHRLPTEEKVLAGCGVFLEDKYGIQELLTSEKLRGSVSRKCRDYYFTNYSFERFVAGLDKVFGQ